MEKTPKMDILLVEFLSFFWQKFSIQGGFQKIMFFQEILNIGADNEIFGKYFKNGYFIYPVFCLFWQKNLM